MEALCYTTSSHLPTSRPKLCNPNLPSFNVPTNEAHKNRQKKKKSKSEIFIRATLSKQTVEISPKPSTISPVEDSLATKSSAPLKRVSSKSLQYESGYLGGRPDRTAADGVLNAMDYLTNILSSKVYDVAIESPLQLAPKLSERLGVNVWLKREDLQPVSSVYISNLDNLVPYFCFLVNVPKFRCTRP